LQQPALVNAFQNSAGAMSSDPGDEGFLQELRKNFAGIQGYSSQIFVMLSLAPPISLAGLPPRPVSFVHSRLRKRFISKFYKKLLVLQRL
jgi:hypothetical protein